MGQLCVCVFCTQESKREREQVLGYVIVIFDWPHILHSEQASML